ncbi:MAG: pyruvate dehydrogenase (acetyl-transferring) E1 component subunit alpha [Pseudomonadales bacterium]
MNTISALKPGERLSILDEDGEFDESIAPEIDGDRLAAMFEAMLRARRFDERQLRLQRQGDIGTFAPVHGQEAAQVGAIACIDADDWFVPSFRESAAALWRGVPMENLLLFSAGYNEGAWLDQGSRNLPIAIPVASQLPHAVGIAYAMQRRGSDRVVMTFFGDGATSEGDFHEAMNFAGVYELPIVFLCQNNQWAISTPRDKQTRSSTLAQKSVAYGFPGIQVDGNDVFAVHAASREAVDRARNGDGPTLIEAVTYRMEVHTTADDPSKYRSETEEHRWAQRDPLDRLRQFLLRRELLSEDGITEIEEDIETEIDDAWARTKTRMSSLTDPGVIFEHHFEDMPPRLQQQRNALTGEPFGKDKDDEKENGDGRNDDG